MKKTFRILSSFVCLLSLAALVMTSCFVEKPQSTTPSDVTTEDNSPAVTTPSENNPSETTTPEITTPGNDSPVDPLGKQIPVYQGMSISTTLGVAMPSFGATTRKNENNGNNGNNGNDGNHYGWYKGDSADEKDDVDQETPFPDADENIEQEIKDSLEVIGSKQEIYYATQNQNIYIHIYISNPDQFEILSFTLNGQKYSSYMFESGSTQELLILKLNVGDAHGIVDYTIDQIKYIDGTEIKDVKIGGNQTVKAGIRTEDQVTANVTDLQIGTNSVTFNATIADKDNLIAYNNGAIKAVLFDGDALVAEKELALGSNTVAFENLTNGTVYQYAIVACYDNLTGDEIGFHVLAKEAFQTNNIVLFDNIVIGQDNISFTFKWDDSVSNKALTGLKLYKNGELVNELNADATSVFELLTASEYVLVAEYQDLGQPATISLTFATLEKGIPSIAIINPVQTQTSVGFEVVETDTDNVGAITKIELLHASGTVEAENIDVRSFANLLSNNTYTVMVTYTYDLNDGNGEQMIVKTREITTEAKVAPQVEINNVNLTSASINADFDFIDIDSVFVSYMIELYKDDTLVEQSTDNSIVFENLEAARYIIKLLYTYDLNDGNGIQTGVCSKEFQTAFTITSDNRTWIGYTDESVENLVIPSYFEYEDVWYCVTSIGDNAFSDCRSLVSVTIPGGVTSIGQQAFLYCESLETVVIPEGVTSIGDLAFCFCGSLTNVTLPTTVTTIGDGAFKGCAITSITIPNGVISIPNYAFEWCEKLTDVTIPNSVTSIGTWAFYSCKSLTNITFNGTVAEWNAIAKADGWNELAGNYTIYCTDGNICTIHPYEKTVTAPTKFTDGYTTYTCSNCGDTYVGDRVPATGSLGLAYEVNSDGTTCTITGIDTCTDTEIYIPEVIDGYTVTAIGENAFANCADVESIIISKTVTDIGNRAFYKCTGIAEIRIPSNVTSIGKQIFLGCEALATVYYDSSYAPMEGETFIKTESIKKIVFGDNLTWIPAYICYNCDNLEEIVFSQNTKYIGNYAFYYCTSVKQINLPEGLISTGWYGFYGMDIKELILPDSVTDIYNSFRECTKLETIVFPVSIISVPNQTFYICYSIKEVYYKGDALDWSGISISDENFELKNATIYFYSETQPVDYGNYWHYVDGVPTVWHTHNYTSKVTPPTATEDGYTTYTCACSDTYTEAIVPTNFTVTEDNRAMVGYTGAEGENLVIPAVFQDNGTWYRVTSIGDDAFSHCSGLASITIPDSVTNIGDRVFADCSSLTSITIPENVTSIGAYAFLNCNNLPAITFEGTVEQWNAIELGFCWNSYCTATEIICSNGFIPLEYLDAV